MPVDVSLDSIRYRVGEAAGDDYDDRPSECRLEEMLSISNLYFGVLFLNRCFPT